ncbi:serine threonine protein kinase : Protein kinase family protein OS=Singulisphaera acidiphila (strain ATCC BAA-1392 / DSM 18658 / VKM B-2454 / MOB10) GN=Sinac_2100 PE=3 SV=1: Pkinase_Tyr [Gemmataceae bacterium]|nr:serine threonine protein kinase : Protein kinase family protein OS=Singulisphaera acidiphila (strain ATCC BAA-1392 / DSM 18658 / VKM B-2454 / MOB10) GN=Sinac_2100 PE=3 SV=1: Pkinase_Tyr [Gemmataceae bacterium]VTU02289.1 serine threonine protein kinase : Protein kinase family protein OS=Singulisphaera acidiphila (strain ATCC BAA-1392 / DSM 18658 / VKM B-2454 / MOB10) GN=Sinac_2100 PE=3 SV=1: Pkinase_Tyr [Gemmataceae bacterium]
MTPTDDRDPVDVLAEEFADRLRRGEHPSVTVYADAHPEHAEQLRELLPAVAQMEFLKRFRRATGPAEKAPVPDRFGDFRIVRELGRGGMGVVFEAVQESLGRPVALKVLSSHGQFEKTKRERFVREAHAAANLHHSNIVPVFGVGEQDGLPYYVMQLIRGEGLNALVHRWRRECDRDRDAAGAASTAVAFKTARVSASRVAPPGPAAHDARRYGDWRFVAELGEQAADALHYAHRQGVLHRDVKPANLLLDPSGRVWVADFGLAKLVQSEGLTASGEILGTLQYLPPESLGGAADERSDVYGLGATLYELLTLEAPYHTDSPAQLLKQLADADPVAPRQLNPAIPRDLETIVMKAMARDPGRRYATARDLARDLEAFLDDRPIKARRQTAIGRGWRWCRRNPAVALLTANMVAALALAGIVGWVGYANTRKALAAEAAQLAEAKKARGEAEAARAAVVSASEKLEANLRMSLEAFDAVFDAAGGQPPGGPPGRGFGPGPFTLGLGLGIPLPQAGARPPAPPGEDERAAVLEAILNFYDKFAEQNATNPKLQLDAGRAHRRVGEVQFARGYADKAAASFRRAASQLEPLAREYPADRGVRTELVLTYLAAPPDAFPDYERLLVRARELAANLDDTVRPHIAASLALKLAWVKGRTGDRAGAERLYREALAALAPPRDPAEPRPPSATVELALARSLLAAHYAEENRFREARATLEEAVGELKRYGDRRGPGGMGGRPPWEAVAAANRQLADVCERLGDHRAAKEARAEAERPVGGPGSFGWPAGIGGQKGPNPPRKN